MTLRNNKLNLRSLKTCIFLNFTRSMRLSQYFCWDLLTHFASSGMLIIWFKCRMQDDDGACIFPFCFLIFQGQLFASLQFNYNSIHLEMNTRNKDWEKNSKGLFAFHSQCTNFKFGTSLECRRMTHPIISLASIVQSLRSLTNFPTYLAEDGS